MTLDRVNIVDLAARFDGSPVELAAKLDEFGDQLLIQTRDWATRLQLRILDEFGPALQQYQLLLTFTRNCDTHSSSATPTHARARAESPRRS